ncbi:MAG: DUF58 domain-containing protein [Chloroflexi bacterium]|nr:DUF58 domain-containing protein [Chloroflexota bacterium]
MLTARFFALALLCPALLLAAAWFVAFAPLALVYMLGLIMLAYLDRRSAGNIAQFTLTRQHDDKLSLAALNVIELRLDARAPRPLPFTVRDEPPHLFVVDQAAHSGVLLPRAPQMLRYHVRPLRRGDFTFGDLNLRWTGPLRLYTRQGVIPAARHVKVYPNLYEIKKYDLLARRDQLAEMGLRNVRQRGEGTEFESLRDYTADDPYRAINWKATARRGRPISTDYEPERSQRVLVMLDVGRLMRSAIRIHDASSGQSWPMAKVDFVLNSVLLFSYVAALKGDQVGLLVFADRVQQFIPPRGGRAHFHTLLEAMYALESQPVEADYGRALMYVNAAHKKRSLVVLFTDISGARASEMLLAHLPRLAPRHLPLLVTIRDPALDQEAQQAMEDSQAVYRRVVAEQLLEERRLLLNTLGQRGVLTLDVDAQHLSMAVVNRYLQLRAKVFA